MSNFKAALNDTNNIRFIDINENHLFDNIQLMTEIDLLIGDYSTLTTDFSILKKPQLFVMLDYKKIKDTKGFAEDLKKILPGRDVKTYMELCNLILESINNSQAYLNEFNKSIVELSEKYIEDYDTGSCKKFLNFHNSIEK